MNLKIHRNGASREVEKVIRPRPHQTVVVFHHALLLSRTYHYLLAVHTLLLSDGSPQATSNLLSCALPHIQLLAALNELITEMKQFLITHGHPIVAQLIQMLGTATTTIESHREQAILIVGS